MQTAVALRSPINLVCKYLSLLSSRELWFVNMVLMPVNTAFNLKNFAGDQVSFWVHKDFAEGVLGKPKDKWNEMF